LSTAATTPAGVNDTTDIEGIEGDNGFIATRDWILQWQSKLPIEPILRLLDFFIPRIDAICENSYDYYPHIIPIHHLYMYDVTINGSYYL
jgi:hypothetical protein